MIFLILLCTGIILYCAYIIRKYFDVWQYSEKFPGKKTLPIIGNAHQLGNTPYDYLHNVYAMTKEYNYAAFRAWLGPQLYVFFTHPKDVEALLSSNTHIEKFDDYRFFFPWIGKGLVTSTGTEWFTHRRIITPSFHFKILNDFHHVINKGATRLAAKLRPYAERNEVFDAQEIVNLATMDVICETSMGIEVDALNNPDAPYVKALHDVNYCVYQRIFSAFKRYDWLFPFFKEYQIQKNALNIILPYNKKVIQNRKKYLMDNETALQDVKNVSDDSTKQRKVFLDTLLTATVDGESLNDEEISDEVSTFIFAGHDTTASAISFVLHHLSLYPEEQAKVYEEQSSIFSDDMDRDSTYQEIQEMKYLDVFIKESQRIIPSVPFIGRNIPKKVEINGKIIPANTSIGVFLYAMGHNPEVFENPEVFNPERFLIDARSHKNPYEYVPFSAGPRNCIGQRFALLEVKTVIAKLLRQYEILPPDIPYKPLISGTSTTKSLNGILIKLKLRR